MDSCAITKLCKPCQSVKPIADFTAGTGSVFYPCNPCRTRKRARQLTRWRTSGLCHTCGANSKQLGHVRCSQCIEQANARLTAKGVQVVPQGICRWCKKAPSRKRHTTCDNCDLLAKRSQQRVRAKRLSRGLCVKCGKNSQATPSTYCERCTEYGRRYSRMRRQEVIERYGGQCACCGEANHYFLTIDHVNNDGAEHRRKAGGHAKTFDEIYKTPYNPRFQLLCHNCNSAKGNYGSCPHTWAQIIPLGDNAALLRQSASRPSRVLKERFVSNG